MTTGDGRSRGDRIGPYELVRVLGRGGTGEVWEALLHGPAGFRKPVALKCLAPGRSPASGDVEGLVREARRGARLQHPNVVGTLGLAEHDGTWAVALELVVGATLADLVRDLGSLPPSAVLDIGEQVAAGLAYIHAAGLVHRDIKPANLLLDRAGAVRVADLGISLLTGEGGRAAGTSGFMAPEQIDGAAEPRSDVFSLGATLYLLATGRRPFGTGLEAIAAVRRVEQTLTSDAFLGPVDAAVPGLGAVLSRCLRADPNARWPGARGVAEALASLRSRLPARGPTLLALLARVRPGLVADPTPSPRSEAPTRLLPDGNVRPSRDPFIGRETELADVRARVLGGDKLVVLVGPGGAGKTRLAMEVARAVRAQLQAGAWTVDLTSARTEDEVATTVARVLGLEATQADRIGRVGHALAAKGRALFVLDNLEQCVDHLPTTLGRWLELAPEACFLGTSRIAPGLRGERRVPLGPLQSPDAVDLFLARSSRPIGPDDQDEVAALCDALDRQPLSIELAAARTHLLSVGQIRKRLGLALLSGGSRDLPERHRSLTASLDWSYELLSPTHQVALGQLSVFEGGFDLASAESVLDLSGLADALDALSGLVDASLLRVDPSIGRFSLLAVVQSYAASKLTTTQRDQAEIRHGRTYAQWGSAEATRVAPNRPRSPTPDLANLIAACRRAVRRNDGGVATSMLGAVWSALRHWGPYEVAAELAEAVVALPDLLPSPRAQACGIAAEVQVSLGHQAAAREHIRAARAANEQVGDRRFGGVLEGLTGAVEYHRGAMDEARVHFRAAIEVAQAYGDRRAEGMLLNNLGVVDREQGDRASARAHYEAALTAHRETGGRRDEASALGNLGVLYREEGRLPEARVHYEAAIEAYREVGNRRAECVMVLNLGVLHLEEGRPDEARALYESVLAGMREIGDVRTEGVVLANLGTLHKHQGRPVEARDSFERSLRIALQTGNRRAEGLAISGLGDLALAAGALLRAQEQFASALAIARSLGDRRLEGHYLVRLAAAHAAEAALERATGLLDEAEVLLRGVGDPMMLTLCLVVRAEVAWRTGDRPAARGWLAEASALAPPDNPDTEAELTRVRAMLSSV